ncbi:hypothetical protein [Streptomyces angustmyceticus]|uniref:hypothetical protein n=1 Tax=Streptomyces angustmyceticus TaxID=285578 RepID=UPI003D8F70BA
MFAVQVLVRCVARHPQQVQAYRLIDIAESAGVLERAIGTAGVLSPAGDNQPGAGLELGLSQRALREVHGRLEEFSRTVTERLAAAGQPALPRRPGHRAPGRRRAPPAAPRCRRPR